MPLVSVIIPAYRHAHLIEQTLQSVFCQVFTDFEVIVVNDGSPDHTEEVLQPYIEQGRIVYLKQENAGQAAARNRGLRVATGEFVALLDDDDCWPPNKLAWQVDRLQSQPSVALVAGDVRFDFASTQRDQSLLASQAQNATFESILVRNPITSPGQTLIRRTMLLKIGGFREDIWGADDWDLYLRLSRFAALELHSRAALFYRQHPGNASHQMVRLLRNTQRVLQTHLAEVEPTERPRHFAEARRWMYVFGVRGAVFEVKESWHRRNLPALFTHLCELIRRLHVLELDLTIIKDLVHDCRRSSFA